jgi:hypothetical protein
MVFVLASIATVREACEVKCRLGKSYSDAAEIGVIKGTASS